MQSEVFVDGEFQEYHYWNRIEGEDLDLTREQFDGTERIEEVRVLTASEIEAKRGGMRADLAERIGVLRDRVTAQLGDGAGEPRGPGGSPSEPV